MWHVKLVRDWILGHLFAAAVMFLWWLATRDVYKLVAALIAVVMASPALTLYLEAWIDGKLMKKP